MASLGDTTARVAVVAYPTLGESDRQWVESTRARHDPQAQIIQAHFTLVFPAEANEVVATRHGSSVLQAASPIVFEARDARAVPDHSGAGGHVFLVPGDGYRELTLLHDRLYANGPFAEHLRRAIPYVPHMTIAADASLARCMSIAEEVVAARRVVQGTLESVDVVRVEGGAVRSLLSCRLGSR